jgi:hypothetical protein
VRGRTFRFVMPGLVPGIHVLGAGCVEALDGRDKPGHDDAESGFDPICRSAAS